MKINNGKSYMTRDGRGPVPVTLRADTGMYTGDLEGVATNWTPTGRFSLTGLESSGDLVQEYIPPERTFRVGYLYRSQTRPSLLYRCLYAHPMCVAVLISDPQSLGGGPYVTTFEQLQLPVTCVQHEDQTLLLPHEREGELPAVADDVEEEDVDDEEEEEGMN